MDKEHIDRGWFLRWPNGSVYNHVTMLDNLTLNQHYRDWRNAEAAAYFVGAIVNSTLLDGVDATFTDDREGVPDEHPELKPELNVTEANVATLQFATQTAGQYIATSLVAAGKTCWDCIGGTQGERNQQPPGCFDNRGPGSGPDTGPCPGCTGGLLNCSTARGAACIKDMRRYCAPSMQGRGMFMSWDPYSAKVHNQTLAAFLVSRPPVAYLGGRLHDADWSPLFALDVGTPLGLCEEQTSGVFSRKWTRGVATLDCNVWQASLPFVSLKSDDVVTSATAAWTRPGSPSAAAVKLQADLNAAVATGVWNEGNIIEPGGLPIEPWAMELIEPALKSDDASYVPLPPAPVLPRLPVLALPELNRGQILQLWGHSQKTAMMNTAVPAVLKLQYAFDAVIMLPRDAHNSMMLIEQQQGSRKDVLSEADFTAGLEAFAQANYSVIFYTSIMHDGHRPDWEDGSLTAARPELTQRDEHGDCPKAYGNCNLSPSSATAFTLNNTIAEVVRFPKAVKAVMIDNAFWQATPLPTGFEDAAVARFKSYMTERFGFDTLKFFGNVTLAPPTTSQRNSTDKNERSLFNMWKIWRETEYANATERYRKGLHPLGVGLLANTDFWPESWTRGDCELLGHVDAVISESHGSSAATMAEKYSLGLGLSPGRPNLNYIAVFSQACQSHFSGDNASCPMKMQEAVRGMVVPAFVAMSRPWLVAWSLSPLVDAPSTPAQTASADELSLLMKFRATHFDDLFNFAGANDSTHNNHAACVGVLTAWRYGNALSHTRGEAGTRPVVIKLRSLGVDHRFETTRTILDFGSLNQSHTTIQTLICDDTVSVDVATASAIGEWVRAGGTLWATDGCATVDELGRAYDKPLLQSDLNNNGIGKGNATFFGVGVALETSKAFLEAAMAMSQIVEPRTPSGLQIHSGLVTSATCPAILPFPCE